MLLRSWCQFCPLGACEPWLLVQSQFASIFSSWSLHSFQAVFWPLLSPATSHLSVHHRESVTNADIHWHGFPDCPSTINICFYVLTSCIWLMFPSCSQCLVSLQTTTLRGFSQCLLTLVFLSHNIPTIHRHPCPRSLHLKSVCNSSLPTFYPGHRCVSWSQDQRMKQQSCIPPHNLPCSVSTQRLCS